MHGYGTKALCVAIPFAADDVKDGDTLFQQFLTTPIQTVDWDLVNYMFFDTALVEGTKGFIDHDDFVHAAYVYCQEFVKLHGDKASITFGITGFGTEIMDADPQHYLADFNAALAAGITKIGIFCLENVLMLGEQKYREFFETLNTADGTFTPDPERLQFAKMIQRLVEAIDFVLPVAAYLVKSGCAMRLIQMLGTLL